MVENKIILRMTIKKIFEVRFENYWGRIPRSSENLSGYLSSKREFPGKMIKKYLYSLDLWISWGPKTVRYLLFSRAESEDFLEFSNFTVQKLKFWSKISLIFANVMSFSEEKLIFDEKVAQKIMDEQFFSIVWFIFVIQGIASRSLKVFSPPTLVHSWWENRKK